VKHSATVRRKSWGRKRHMLTDTLGLLLEVKTAVSMEVARWSA
jgi:hypothetical protein